MSSPLPAHATILVHHVSPLSASHARQRALGELQISSRCSELLLQLSHTDIRAHGADEAQDAPSEDLRWTIKNKYYTADVGFRVLELLDEEGDGDEPAVIVFAAREEVSERFLRSLRGRADLLHLRSYHMSILRLF